MTVYVAKKTLNIKMTKYTIHLDNVLIDNNRQATIRFCVIVPLTLAISVLFYSKKKNVFK